MFTRYTVKFKPQKDQNIRVSFNGNSAPFGYDEGVTKLIETETDGSINDVVDGERIRYTPTQSLTLNVSFWNGSSFVQTVAPLEGILANSTELNASFYINQVYDSTQEEIQTKLHTGYFNGYEILKKGLLSTYQYNSNTDFSSFYLNRDFITNITTPTSFVYMKLNFYSGKSGKVYPFYNFANDLMKTEEKMYFKVLLDHTTRQYTFVGLSSLTAREFLNSTYVNFVNNTVDNLPQQVPTYPQGNTFTDEGQYIVQ